MSEILDALTEKQLEALRAGEQIKIATQLREPITGGVPSSFNKITIELTTSGVIKDLESEEELLDHFPDVKGLEELIEDE